MIALSLVLSTVAVSISIVSILLHTGILKLANVNAAKYEAYRKGPQGLLRRPPEKQLDE